MFATNGIIPGKKSLRTLVGSGSSEHDFDGASMIVFCMSVMEHFENSSKTVTVDSRDDRIALP